MENKKTIFSQESVRTAKREKQLKRIRKFRQFLIVALIVEVFILLLVYPGYPGIPALESALIRIRDFLLRYLWPTTPSDEGTYKNTIFQICQQIRMLPFYPLLRVVVPYVAPACLIGTFIHSGILKAKPIKLSQVLPTPTIATITCAINSAACSEANSYLKAQMSKNQKTFHKLQGIRVRLLSADSHQQRDYIVPWGSDGSVTLKNVINKGDIRLSLRNGRVFLHSVEGEFELRSDQPVIFNRTNAGGKLISQSVITWIGGNQ